MNVITYKEYKGTFEYDQEANIFHGDVQGMPDVVTFQGCSIGELKEAMHNSIEDYLAFCKEKGKTPERQYSWKFNIRVEPELHRRIASRAAESGKSLNQWLHDSLDELVK